MWFMRTLISLLEYLQSLCTLSYQNIKLENIDQTDRFRVVGLKALELVAG